MSSWMNMEADPRLTTEQVKQALAECGTDKITERKHGIAAYFPESGLFITFTDHAVESDEIFTEGRGFTEEWDKNWTVGSRIGFRYFNPKWDLCNRDMYRFMEKLAKISEAYFVFSYDHVYINAVRDSRGLRFFEEFAKLKDSIPI